ncbi:AraC family transcriptional regulator [Pararobbsia alpina]|uniref:helix-turn-helix domain-containing protein n=1 Tax=Pararobbsia alpina TaxID=621374 RepID=UPI0039A7550A
MSLKVHPRIAPADLNQLMSVLEIRVVGLSECLVSSGYRLDLRGHTSPGLHYILKGSGLMRTAERATPIEVRPHTLIVVPPGTAFKLEAPDDDHAGRAPMIVDGRSQTTTTESIRRYVAGDADPAIVMICGYFHAMYAPSMDIFDALSTPIVEQFDEKDQLDIKLRNALDELVAQEIGAGAISAALLKQVIVALVRRSLGSMQAWTERFSMLSDPPIARVFADMVANPGDAHTVESLAEKAFLSRSAFMARFTSVVGRSPMMVLRDLRMKQAGSQLVSSGLTIDQVAQNAGYASRSSFVRAFKSAYDMDPSEYRTLKTRDATSSSQTP